MILEFIKKGITVIESMRLEQNDKKSNIKDLNFNLISQKVNDDLIFQENSQYLFVTIEVYFQQDGKQFLLEQWIFSVQNHEKRKNLKLLESHGDLQIKLSNLLRIITSLSIILPVYKFSKKLQNNLTINKITSFQNMGSFPDHQYQSFPSQAEEFSLFYIDKQIKKFSFKLQYQNNLQQYFNVPRKISNQSEIRQNSWLNRPSSEEEEKSKIKFDLDDPEFDLKEYDDQQDETYYEAAFVDLQEKKTSRKVSTELSFNLINSCDFLKHSQDDEVSDFIGEIQQMRKIKNTQKNMEQVIKHIQDYYIELQ